MKRIGLSVFRLLACSIAILGIRGSAQEVRPTSSGPGGEGEPSPCIAEATIQVTASHTQITYPQSSVVSWSVGLPSGCAAVRVRLNGEDVGRNGSRTVTPYQNSTYAIHITHTLQGVTSQKRASTRIEVTYPGRIVIDPSTPDPVQVLLAALGRNRIVVELCNVELDLTRHYLEIGDNTSLIASPQCARGLRNRGPRIFVTEHRGSNPLFSIRGDNVQFSGFRLEGPTSGIGAGERLEKGIQVFPFDCDTLDGTVECAITNIEISNMEIFHWSGAGIEVIDNTTKEERGRLFNTNERAVRIQNNFIHHNRHGSGSGYGVKVDAGAYVLIQQNVFDQNRHAIAGGSSDFKKDYTGYTARENLILEGGGRHCNDHPLWALTGWTNLWPRCRQTHQVDMHGDKNAFYSGSNWCCGVAGETIILERNTILYKAGTAIKIRGNPADKAVADGNVFRHTSRNDAIVQNGDLGPGPITNPIDVRPNNIFGATPMKVLGTCDFVGDAIQDRFMATGATWWVQSGKTFHWRYLNTMPEPFSKLQVGNVDNDGICDVAIRSPSPVIPPRTYSKNGTGPWQPVQVVEP